MLGFAHMHLYWSSVRLSWTSLICIPAVSKCIHLDHCLHANDVYDDLMLLMTRAGFQLV